MAVDRLTNTMAAAIQTIPLRDAMNKIMAIARSGIFRIPGIRLCERSAWCRSGFKLHFLSLSRLCASSWPEDVMFGMRQLCNSAMPHRLQPCGPSRNQPGFFLLDLLKFGRADVRMSEFNWNGQPDTKSSIVLSAVRYSTSHGGAAERAGAGNYS